MMPAWAMLQPSALAKQLPILWAYKYEPDTGRFVGRLAGGKISQMFGKSIRGMPMEDIFDPGAFEWAHHLYHRVVEEPAVYYSSGQIYSHLERHGLGERIILPLSSDGISADGLLGATEYRYRHTVADLIAEYATEERWCCLRPPRSNESVNQE